jgi:ribosomal protein S8E
MISLKDLFFGPPKGMQNRAKRAKLRLESKQAEIRLLEKQMRHNNDRIDGNNEVYRLLTTEYINYDVDNRRVAKCACSKYAKHIWTTKHSRSQGFNKRIS